MALGGGSCAILPRVREIYRSPFFIASVNDERRILSRARTDRAFETISEAQEAYEAMLKVVELFDRATHALLVDTRLAPPRNDPAFEQLIHRFYPRLYAGYPRIAAVVKTQVGRLQITRIAQAFNYDIRTFMTEGEARAYLESAGAPDYPPRATALPESRSASTRPPSRKGP